MSNCQFQLELFPPTRITPLLTTNNFEKREISRGRKHLHQLWAPDPHHQGLPLFCINHGTVSSRVSQGQKSSSFKVRVTRLSMCVAGPFSLITFVQREQRRVNSCCSYRPQIGHQAPAGPGQLDHVSQATVPECQPPSFTLARALDLSVLRSSLESHTWMLFHVTPISPSLLKF